PAMAVGRAMQASPRLCGSACQPFLPPCHNVNFLSDRLGHRSGLDMSIVLKTVAIVIGLYLAGFVLFAATLPAAPPALGKPDAIVALTGGGARLDAAVALFERGVGKRLLISGVAPSTTKKEIKALAHGGAR